MIIISSTRTLWQMNLRRLYTILRCMDRIILGPLAARVMHFSLPHSRCLAMTQMMFMGTMNNQISTIITTFSLSNNNNIHLIPNQMLPVKKTMRHPVEVKSSVVKIQTPKVYHSSLVLVLWVIKCQVSSLINHKIVTKLKIRNKKEKMLKSVFLINMIKAITNIPTSKLTNRDRIWKFQNSR